MAARGAHTLGGSFLDKAWEWIGWDSAEISDVESGDDFSWGLIAKAEAPKAEALINRYAERVGYAPISEDGDVGIKDAKRAVKAYRWVLDNLMSDANRADAVRSKMDKEIGELGLGRWFWDNGPVVLNVLADVDARIESGELEPGPGLPFGLDVKKATMIGAGLVGLSLVWRSLR